jgi:protein PsiE
MEKIVKQIQLLTLILILISTVIAIGSELMYMISIQKVTLADLLLLFLYLEVLAMIRVFWESQSIQITLPLFIAITALARFIILQGKSINPEILVYEASAILLIALAILVLRFRNSPVVGLDKKKKRQKTSN